MSSKRRLEVPRVLAIADAAQLERVGQPWLDTLVTCHGALWLREKKRSDRGLLALAVDVRRRFAGTLLISGRFDIARAARADGVHLPALGLPSRVVRETSPSALLGRSLHRLEELPEGSAGTLAEGCDYVTISPVFETPSKAGVPGLGVQFLTKAVDQARSTTTLVLALGGIDVDTAERAFEAGAHGVAAIRGLESPRNIERIAAIAARWPSKRP